MASSEDEKVKPVEGKYLGGGYDYEGYGNRDASYGRRDNNGARMFGRGNQGYGHHQDHLVPIKIPYVDRNGMYRMFDFLIQSVC